MFNSLQNKVSNNLNMDKEIEELKIRVNNETKIVEEANELMRKVSRKNARILMNDPNALVFYNEIELETEEQNEKFVSDTKKKEIEIKMEVPTAPEEDEVTPDITIQNVSEIEIPKAHSIPAHEIKNEINELESDNSYVEKETSKLEQYKRINAKNDQIMAAWYA